MSQNQWTPSEGTHSRPPYAHRQEDAPPPPPPREGGKGRARGASGIQEVGELFRKRRSEMNLSIKEVENATSIRIAYLQAIEEGRISELISPVYAKGFVKQYAQFLNLDGEKIIEEHPYLLRPPERQEFTYGIGTLEMRGSPTGGVKWLPNLLWVAATLGLLAAAYYVAHALGLL